MKYIQVKITTTHEGAEILTGVLMNAGINDISIHDPDEIRAMLDCVGEGECYDSLQVPDNDDRDVTLSVFLPDTKEGIRKASEIKQKLTLDNDTFENTGKSRFFERRTSRVLY